jgi:hypothetical protein
MGVGASRFGLGQCGVLAIQAHERPESIAQNAWLRKQRSAKQKLLDFAKEECCLRGGVLSSVSC